MDTESWRQVRALKQAKRASNREQSAAALRREGVEFESKNGGAHLIIAHTSGTFDFWPGTGKWRLRGAQERPKRGLYKLLIRLRGRARLVEVSK